MRSDRSAWGCINVSHEDLRLPGCVATPTSIGGPPHDQADTLLTTFPSLVALWMKPEEDMPADRLAG